MCVFVWAVQPPCVMERATDHDKEPWSWTDHSVLGSPPQTQPGMAALAKKPLLLPKINETMPGKHHLGFWYDIC